MIVSALLVASNGIGIVTTIAVAVGIAVTALGVITSVKVWGSIIRSLFNAPKPGGLSFGFVGPVQGSPRYGTFGPLDNTISNEVAVPVTYGILKVAGNSIWQSEPDTTIKRIVAICEGEIGAIYDVRANDNPYSILQGSSFTTYLGTPGQKADSRLPEEIRPDMEFHHLAYIATTLKSGKNLSGGNPTVTSIVQGLKVEVWGNGVWGTTKEFSRNPAACVRDLLTNTRYGLGIPKANIDEDSFGEIYDYCEELVDASAGSGFEGFKSATVVLLRMDGPDESTKFEDKGLTRRKVTAQGNAQVDTAQFVFGGGSCLLDGIGDYLKIAKGKEGEAGENDFEFLDFNFGIYSFTVNFFVRLAAVSATQGFFSIGGTDLKLLWNQATGNLELTIRGVIVMSRAWSPSANVWYHIEVSRSGSDVQLFVDGVQQGATVTNSSKIDGGDSAECGRSDSTNYLNGWIDDFKVVKGAAIHTANFTPPGSKENRYRLDYTVDSAKPAQDVINDILATFLGFVVYAGNKIKLRCEKIETVTQYFGDGSTTAQNATFDPSNIVRESFSWNLQDNDERPNRIRVQWVDPDQNWVKVYTQVEDRPDQEERGGVIPKDISLLGITRQSQASRIARIHMSSAKFVNVSVQFTARLDSIHCEVGDVVAVTHQASKFTRKLFRITQMQEAENEQIQITAAEYNASIFDNQYATTMIAFQGPAGPNLSAPLSDATALAVREDNFKNKDGVFVTNLLLSWTAIPDDQLLRLSNYFVEISEDGGANYRPVSYVDKAATGYRIDLGQVPTGRNYTVRVSTISDKGSQSEGVTIQITTAGKQTGPSDVEDFNVELVGTRLAFTWSAVDDADLFAYEIRVGNSDSTWETAAIVATEVQITRYDFLGFTTGLKKFFVKAIDNSANYSEKAASDSINITAIPESNIAFRFDLWSRVTYPIEHPAFGTVSERTTEGQAGALQLNGATQYVEVPDSNDWNFADKNFVLEGWFMFFSIGANFGFFSQGGGADDKWQFYWDTTDGLTFFVRSGGATVISGTAAWTPSLNVWYHVALSRNGNDFRFWVNDDQQGSTFTDSSDMPDITAPLRIGVYETDAGAKRYLHGRMDEIRITKGRSRYITIGNASDKPFKTDAETMLLFHLDETSGPIAFDSSGLKHHGTVNTNPNWQGGKVRRLVRMIQYVPSPDFNPKYYRSTLQVRTKDTWYDIQANQSNLGQTATFSDLQASGFRFGKEIFTEVAEETYETAMIDMGKKITGTFVLDWQTYTTTNFGFVSPEISTSDDDVTYSAYVTFVPGTYAARYVKFRFKMRSIGGTPVVRLIAASLTVDVPDIRQSLLNEPVSAGGRTFYLTGFTKVKSIIVSIVGTSQYDPRINDQSGLPSSFDVRINDLDGVPVAGNVNIQVAGY